MALRTRSSAARVLIWASLGAAAACALAYAGYIAAGEPGALSDVAGRWVYHATLAFASLTFFLRAALVPDRRGAWIAFGLGLALWAAGDLYWTLIYTGVHNVPYPSLADERRGEHGGRPYEPRLPAGRHPPDRLHHRRTRHQRSPWRP